MKVVAKTGKDDMAFVYIVEYENGKMLECVESLQPPFTRDEKWILLTSTMHGCPVGCKMCDAGGYFHGKPTAEEILEQIDFMVVNRYPDRRVLSKQFKIQFARMGEPALNDSVLDVLEELPKRYDAPGLMPSISSVAPKGTDAFFERLLEIKNRLYSSGHFQFQFSIHTTDLALRDELVPVKKWDFAKMAAFGERFYEEGDRKVTLNFALAQGQPLDPEVLKTHFSPDVFLIKITPLNPTYRAVENNLESYIDPHEQNVNQDAVVKALEEAGYDVIVSIGEVEENLIGSNCGQYLRRHMEAGDNLSDGYTYELEEGMLSIQ
ncbi:MAG: radical SAM protein [Anaerolineae bacterium]|jgi:23S rRNA (adenine2503-C2)-methyltransferase|nr:radical SAM protein [Anaerolineae bacterium]MBT7192215.1 radical SAM protein [Anaerolineae bacterium]MBT7989638.1 radical SAM protein [Anaerolineae bacterium]